MFSAFYKTSTITLRGFLVIVCVISWIGLNKVDGKTVAAVRSHGSTAVLVAYNL